MRIDQFLQQFFHYWRLLTAKVHQILTPIREPLLKYSAPAREQWAIWTAPLRARWAIYAQGSPRAARIFEWIFYIGKIGFGSLFALIVSVWIGFFGFLPSKSDLKEIQTANASYLYASDSTLLGKYYLENRNSIALSDISPFVVKALIATEDKRFLEHKGIDLRSWGRVIKGILTANPDLGGGSTLSQQLAKNLYPRRKYWFGSTGGLLVSKIKENFISVRLEKVYSKEEILALYLNTVPFGNDIFGISVAAKRYFNTKAKDLSPDQAAILIGMLKATTYYNPVRNPNNSLRRRNDVLQQMYKNGDLTEKELEKLSKIPIKTSKYYQETTNDGQATYFREQLRRELDEKLKSFQRPDGETYNLYTDGLRIYTTLDSRMQAAAEKAVAEMMKKNQANFSRDWKNVKKDKPWGDEKYILEAMKGSERYQRLQEAGASEADIQANFEQPVKMTVFSWETQSTDKDTTITPMDSIRYYFTLLNCGFLAMDHRTGDIKAWVGGINFKYFKYDHVRANRQVGSTFKPIVYAAALQKGVNPCDFFSASLFKIADWEPRNADNRYGGYYTMAGALQNSVNTVTARMIAKAGVDETIALAHQLGIKNKLPKEAGIALGSAEISLLEMVNAYATIANSGHRPEPTTILRIETKDGKVLYEQKKMSAKDLLASQPVVLTDTQSILMTEMMRRVIDYGTGKGMRNRYWIDTQLAGKTGTTQNQSDGWFICYNPILVTGAWVGGIMPVVQFRSMGLGQGSATALPIVGTFWHTLANDKKHRKILYATFKHNSPDSIPFFSCPPYYYDHPDSIQLTDSLFYDEQGMDLDSLLGDKIDDLKSGFKRMLGKKDQTEVWGDELEEKEEENVKKGEEKQQRKEERKEKTKEFFDKVLQRDQKREGGG